MDKSLAPGISSVSVYLPDHVLGNEEVKARFGFQESFLSKKLGIENRHLAGPDEAVSDMAVKAGERLIDKLDLPVESIELLILCTQNPDYNIPTTVNIVQDRLNLPKTIAAFEINQGCSGYIYALSMAKAIMLSENFSRAILITSDAYSKITNPDDRYTVPIFGDGATATLVEMGGPGTINKFSYGSDGSGYDKLIVRGGGSRHPDLKREGKDALYMDGAAIFKFMMTTVPQSIEECLESNDLGLDDIDYFVLHQASRFMLGSLASALHVPMERIPLSLKETGNTVSSSIPITINQIGCPDKLENKKLLLSGFGTGLSWATTILTF
jgi:3-oxoacyl-[acyl-carrier-protein] synthase-3